MEPVTRRQSTSHIAHWFWDAVGSLCSQKSPASIEKIGKILHRLHDMNEEDVKKHLSMLMADGLLVCEKKVGGKGQPAGLEFDNYRSPTVEEMEKSMDEHDWYCFECHQSGPVFCCQSCPRVYHGNCLPAPYKDETGALIFGATFECPVCKEKDTKDSPPFRRRALNRLLNYVYHRLHFRLPYPIIQRDLTIPPMSIEDLKKEKPVSDSPSSTPQPLGENTLRVKFLLRSPIELDEIRRKTVLRRYTTITEYLHDVQMIMHNAAVYHGVNSVFADAARAMIRDCTYDLNEIRQCRYCYRVSNEMKTQDWFCEPCYPKHELVFARQKGYPFWPAKVIKKNGNIYDVRFFGGEHERANIDYNNIKPIDSSVQKLQIKKTGLWNKAYDELNRHQDMLQKAPFEPVESEGEDDPAPSDAEEEEAKNFYPLQGKSEKAASKTPSKKLKTPKKEEPACPAPILSVKKTLPKKLKRELDESVTASPKKTKREPVESINPETLSGEESKAPKPKKKKTAPASETRAGSEDLVTSTSQELAKTRRDASAEKFPYDAKEEIARLKASHEKEIQDLVERHKAELAEVKKKQWCYNCESEAIYHCCWNTAYCSIECQQVHWQREHKRSCRRKRATTSDTPNAAPEASTESA